MYDNVSFEMGQSVDDLDMNATVSSTSASPPEKPKRSFRHKREEGQETTTYLERCDHKVEERRTGEQEEHGGGELKEGSETETNQEINSKDREDSGEGREEKGMLEDKEDERDLEENGKGCEMHKEEERGVSYLYLSDVNRIAKTEEKTYSEDEERKEEMPDQREEQDNEQEREVGSREKEIDVETKDEEQEVDEGEKRSDEEQSQHLSSDSDDEETGTEIPEDTKDEGGKGEKEALSSPPRRRRVIRLYQYDEDGQRYCHLPEPSPKEPAPVLRQKQRSVSLTRLNTIMAAASEGPLDRRETEEEEREGRPQFHMDI